MKIKKSHQPSHIVACPYEDIFIYLINGPVSEEDEEDFSEAFIGNWVEDETSFLFFSRPSPKAISSLLNRRPELALIEEYHFTYEEWQGGGFESLKIENFLIIPPWERAQAAEKGIIIRLDPGVVFGTGLHHTTRDCLRALACLGKVIHFESVLDLGTGTGILAIATVRLGAKNALAIDTNPLSVKTARKNVAHNGLEDQIRVQQGRAEAFIKAPVDLVMANIHHDAMASLLKREAFFQKKWFILSGLMRTQARDIMDKLEKRGLEIVRKWDHEMIWYTVLVKNRFTMV